MVKRKGLINGSLQLTTFGLLSFLFYEILNPLPDISNTVRVDGFIIFSIIVLAIYLLFNNKIIIFLLNLFSILLILTYLYKLNIEGYASFLARLYEILRTNISLAMQANWGLLSAEFNTLVTLLFLSLFIYFIIGLIKKNHGLWVVILFIIYFSIIDTFFGYDSKWAVIKTLVAGLIFVGIEKQRDILKQTKDIKAFSLYFPLAVLVFSLIIVIPGYFLPKAEASWFQLPDSLAFMQGDDYIPGLKNKKIGYGNDDSVLGGPLENDDTIIMETVSTRRVYWRGESKDEYTGRGWVNSEEALQTDNILELKIDGSEDYDFPYHLIKDNAEIETEEVEQKLFFPDKTYYHFFYTGDFEEIRIEDSPDVNTALINVSNNKLYSENMLSEYYIKSSIPIIDIDLLKKSDLANLTSDERKSLEPYLQLPDNLPNRVTNLSIDITRDLDNSYDKVLAIRNYLRTNYVYDLNAPQIDKNEDFVDNFLFESKVGYCDHFSTSMVIMARSVGIPARWVKGFSPGELSYENGQFVGTVRSNDAHSWVEVYFPEVGWISFEPTPSFNYPLDFTLNENIENENRQSPAENEQPDKMNNELSPSEEKGDGKSLSRIFVTIGLVLLLLLVGVLILLHQYKTEFSFFISEKRFSKIKSLQEVIVLATEKMLNLLGRKHGKREQSQTVREYLTSLSKHEKKEYTEVIDIFEIARYSKNDISDSWRKKIWDSWKRLIR